MTHVMAKGANISLTAASVRAVLRWNATPGSPDVDVSALLLGPGGKVRSDADFVFYNQPSHPSGLVRHLPKQQPAGGGEVSDLVEVDLAQLPPEVERVVLAASAEGGTFPAVAQLRLLLHDTGRATTTVLTESIEPIAEFAVTDTGEVSALVAAELYRRDGGWKFRAIGQGYAAGLGGLATDFGIAVDDEDTPGSRPTTQPDPRDEPGTYTLAPAVPMPSAPPLPPPLPPQQPGYTYQQAAPAAAYGYPQQTQQHHQQPQQPQQQQQQQQQQPSYGYPPQQPPPSYGYGYPPPPPQPPQQQAAQQQQAPQQQAPQQQQQPHHQEQAPIVLPLQGPQFQPR
ncbi:TerD family protein [Kitasatospora sp. MAP5-34]|uniref:TerD family protein n=1 Tax=Kitasatospora sp. MAP5-34 TaxID=3035102 RepID=UPI002475DCF7|nr:TerD family protein [Kitasatospora sp. MAP5-34]MDH6574897.1 stress response protein SCP2 [Kitasatospora sp. MAP5-34]